MKRILRLPFVASVNVGLELASLIMAAIKQKKLMGITIGAILGALIGLTTREFPPEIIALIAGLATTPFLMIEARFQIIGGEVLFLSAGALLGALAGAMSGPPVNGLTGALAGSAVVAIARPVIEKFSA
jgi:hypothetical protein